MSTSATTPSMREAFSHSDVFWLLPGTGGGKEACIAAFKEGFKFKDRKIYVAEDFSQRIQSRCRALLPELKKLQKEGGGGRKKKEAFFCVPRDH